MKAKLNLILFFILCQINVLNVFADEDEWFPENSYFDRVNRVRNITDVRTFELFHNGLYLEWKQQATVYSINRLDDVVEITRMYVYENCEWNINEMYILRKKYDNVNLTWVAFVWVNSKDRQKWNIQLYAMENSTNNRYNSSDSLWDALEKNKNYMFVITRIEKHNLYVRTPYFEEVVQSMDIKGMGIIEKTIIVTLPEMRIGFMFSNSTRLLHNNEEGFIIFPISTQDGLQGFFDFIDRNIGQRGYNPLTIRER